MALMYYGFDGLHLSFDLPMARVTCWFFNAMMQTCSISIVYEACILLNWQCKSCMLAQVHDFLMFEELFLVLQFLALTHLSRSALLFLLANGGVEVGMSMVWLKLGPKTTREDGSWPKERERERERKKEMLKSSKALLSVATRLVLISIAALSRSVWSLCLQLSLDWVKGRNRTV